MATRNLIVGVLLFALASPALPLGERYLLPKAAEVTLQVDADPKSPGTYTVTGKVKALASDLPQAAVEIRLPRELEPLGAVPAKKGTIARGQEVVLTVKVKLKDPTKRALLGFAVTYDHPVDFWRQYILDNQKRYPNMQLRDHLLREVEDQRGHPVTLAEVFMIEGSAR